MLRFVAVAADRPFGWASSAAGPWKIFRIVNLKKICLLEAKLYTVLHTMQQIFNITEQLIIY
jgi:hypothetical protein